VSTELPVTPLASFEAKWAQAYPEFALALRFVRGAERDARSAFACLVFEIEHAAFGIREAQPAAVKLQWWAEELMRAGNGEARHPLTQALGARLAREQVPTALWHEAIVGALAQRDPEPAADGQLLLDQYAQFFAPLAKIESALFGASVQGVMGILTLRRALRETASLSTALRDGKLPLPLDLLAAHRLSRGDLANASPERTLALREWIGRLGRELLGAVAISEHEHLPPLGVLRATMAAADGERAVAVRHGSSEPLDQMNQALKRLSIRVVWSAWRAARRSRV
jgi:phytoene synthase